MRKNNNNIQIQHAMKQKTKKVLIKLNVCDYQHVPVTTSTIVEYVQLVLLSVS
jgi:hypothetical protein